MRCAGTSTPAGPQAAYDLKKVVCYMTLARYPDPRELTLCSHYRIYISRD